MILYRYDSFDNQDGQILLSMAIRDYCARKDIPFSYNADSLEIIRGQYGKPVWAGSAELHFSISHSGKYWICAIQSDPIGVDIEAKDKGHTGKLDENSASTRYLKIAERFFTDDEKQYAKLKGFEGFLHVWVRKEAYVKFKGTGLTEGFKSFSVVAGGMLVHAIGHAGLYRLEAGEGLVGAYCSEYPSEFEGIVDLEKQV